MFTLILCKGLLGRQQSSMAEFVLVVEIAVETGILLAKVLSPLM